MSAGALALIALIPGIHYLFTFVMFHNGWGTYIVSVSIGEAFALYFGRKGLI